MPCFTANAIASSSKNEPCSTESTPALMAVLIPSVPCACAATVRPRKCASSINAFISSNVNCCAPTLVPLDRTPPVAQNLMTSAPYLIFCLTFAFIAQGPSATPSEVTSYSKGNKLLSQWPPVTPIEGPDTNIRGPSTSPSLIALRKATSA